MWNTFLPHSLQKRIFRPRSPAAELCPGHPSTTLLLSWVDLTDAPYLELNSKTFLWSSQTTRMGYHALILCYLIRDVPSWKLRQNKRHQLTTLLYQPASMIPRFSALDTPFTTVMTTFSIGIDSLLFTNPHHHLATDQSYMHSDCCSCFSVPGLRNKSKAFSGVFVTFLDLFWFFSLIFWLLDLIFTWEALKNQSSA